MIASQWTAVRHDGTTYQDSNSTYEELKKDQDLKAVILSRGDSCVVAHIPDGATPFFLRRWRQTVNLDGFSDSEQWEFASCIGWSKEEKHSLAWLLHDGSIVLTDETDIDNISV